jgi:phosphomannomutase
VGDVRAPGTAEPAPGAIDRQIALALAHPALEPTKWPRAPIVAVDGCRSVGGLATPRALRELGCTVIEVDCEADGAFTRGLEPIPENLGALGEAVRLGKADFGLAHDPDADRCALVGPDGVPFGEEATLAWPSPSCSRATPGPW